MHAGPVVQVQESDGLIALARKSRRFFPPGAAAEIWRECRPLLADTNRPDAYLVSNFLCSMQSPDLRQSSLQICHCLHIKGSTQDLDRARVLSLRQELCVGSRRAALTAQ